MNIIGKSRAHNKSRARNKSRDHNLKVAMFNCLISDTLETLVLLVPYDVEQIAKV